MATIELKVVRIGNSRGVRLPAESLRRHGIGAAVVMEERVDGILLRPLSAGVSKLSWEETAAAMAASAENWGDFESAIGDGLDDSPWRPPAAETSKAPGPSKRGSARRGRRKP